MVSWSGTLVLLIALTTITLSVSEPLPGVLEDLRASIVKADPNDISISGVSSGALAAVQYHVAYSKTTRGVGVLAGGPYYAARNNMVHALAIMVDPYLISVPTLALDAQNFAAKDLIDKVEYLRDSRAWFISGTLDIVVSPKIMHKAVEFYQHFMNNSQISTMFTLPATHAVPTDNWGPPCWFLGGQFIDNCNYSAVGVMFEFLYNTKLYPRRGVVEANLREFPQEHFVPPPYKASSVGIAHKAFIYVPTNCSVNGTRNNPSARPCRFHVALHGCLQPAEGLLGESFVRHAGYNDWAEANNIIVLYPQVHASLLNPMGCWDWWGYTGSHYAQKGGPQMATIKNMVDYFTSA